MTYLDNLNPSQREAATHTDGALLIFAGAGSGKTRVLTYRVAYLIEQGIDPYHIIAITFTNKAAREMRERISAITPLGEQVWVSTFHAACTRILRREFNNTFSIYDTADTLRLIKDCVKQKNLSDTNYPPRHVAQIISAQKNNLISHEQYEKFTAGDFRASNIAEIYALYQQRLKESNALDFDDIIFKTVEILSRNEEIRLKYENRFRYVLVDEYQDTNRAQYELVRLFSGYAQNLCVVGDDDQSIYGWRGANIENILRFEKDYPGAKVVKLEQNYRSTQTILDAANAVISQNEERAEKTLWTENFRGENVRLFSAYNEREEGAFVASVIEKNVRNGARYSDFAILYRANSQSRGVEDQFVAAGIPYRIFSGTRFYEHTEIKDILAYLKAINNSADDVALMRIINVPRRGIGAASIERVQSFAFENGLNFSQAIERASEIPNLKSKSVAIKNFSNFFDECKKFSEKNSVWQLMQKILHDTNYLQTIADGTPEGEEREANVKELLAKALAFENESDDTSLAKFLEDVALVADIDNYNEHADAAALMTLHSAKGLEFDTVFIVGMEEFVFPTARSIDSTADREMQEERRLCYVGFTRAKKILYVTHAVSRRRFDQIARNKISRFVDDIPPNCIASVDLYGNERTVRAFSKPAEKNAALPPALAALAKPAEKNGFPEKKTIEFTRNKTEATEESGFPEKKFYEKPTALPPALAALAKPAEKNGFPGRKKTSATEKNGFTEGKKMSATERSGSPERSGFPEVKKTSATERSGSPEQKKTSAMERSGFPERKLFEKLSVSRPISAKATPPDFSVGDTVRQAKFGTGIVLAIENAGADYEITVQFPTAGRKKFMQSLARLKKE
ncbi:MAG: UvrD-helicase domain-containing protein [Defluviitaleaceae bacterium]|nr:UvrD-helicase domain-containing protein [Defluviitaleaceae bacterium]